MKLYIVTGGLGKHFMFSTLIEKLAKEEKIYVMSAYPDVFKYHPRVEMSVGDRHPGFYDEYIIGKNLDIIHVEPYYSNYAKGQTHLLYEWGKLLGVDYKSPLKFGEDRPDIYVDQYAIAEAKRFVERNGKFIMVQFSGGQELGTYNPTKKFQSHGQKRDYPRHLAEKVIDGIKKKYPDLTILNFCLPNEENFNLKGTINIQAPYMFFAALSQFAETFVSIDSSLHHMASHRYNNKRGVILWGSTGPKNLGYDNNINISKPNSFHNIRPLVSAMGDMYNSDESIYEIKQDVMYIDPEIVLCSIYEALEQNSKIVNLFDNVIGVEEEGSKEIAIESSFANILIGLYAQANGLQSQANRMLQQYIQKEGLERDYVLSDDGTKLIKIS